MAERSVHLVRHGETEGESSVRYHGRNDVPLSELGREQVRRLVPWLDAHRFAAVVHSPLSRAAESARLLVDAFAVRPPRVEAHQGLTEVHFGALEGLTEGEIRAAFPDWHRAWRAGTVDAYPQGETFAGFTARVAAAWDDLLSRHPEGDLLLVVHRGVIKRALQHCLRWSEAQAVELRVELGSVSVVRGEGGSSGGGSSGGGSSGSGGGGSGGGGSGGAPAWRLLSFNRVPGA